MVITDGGWTSHSIVVSFSSTRLRDTVVEKPVKTTLFPSESGRSEYRADTGSKNCPSSTSYWWKRCGCFETSVTWNFMPKRQKIFCRSQWNSNLNSIMIELWSNANARRPRFTYLWCNPFSKAMIMGMIRSSDQAGRWEDVPEDFQSKPKQNIKYKNNDHRRGRTCNLLITQS